MGLIRIRAKHPTRIRVFTTLVVDALPLQLRGLFEAEAPGGNQEKDQTHQQQEAELGQDLGEARVFCHNAVVAFQGMGMGGEFREDADEAFRAEHGRPGGEGSTNACKNKGQDHADVIRLLG